MSGILNQIGGDYPSSPRKNLALGQSLGQDFQHIPHLLDQHHADPEIEEVPVQVALPPEEGLSSFMCCSADYCYQRRHQRSVTLSPGLKRPDCNNCSKTMCGLLCGTQNPKNRDEVTCFSCVPPPPPKENKNKVRTNAKAVPTYVWFVLCREFRERREKTTMNEFIRNHQNDVEPTKTNFQRFPKMLKRYDAGELTAETKGVRQKPGAFMEVENYLVSYLKARRTFAMTDNLGLSSEEILAGCKNFIDKHVQDDKYKDFKVSEGWLRNVLKRHNMMNIMKESDTIIDKGTAKRYIKRLKKYATTMGVDEGPVNRIFDQFKMQCQRKQRKTPTSKNTTTGSLEGKSAEERAATILANATAQGNSTSIANTNITTPSITTAALKPDNPPQPEAEVNAHFQAEDSNVAKQDEAGGAD